MMAKLFPLCEKCSIDWKHSAYCLITIIQKKLGGGGGEEEGRGGISSLLRVNMTG